MLIIAPLAVNADVAIFQPESSNSKSIFSRISEQLQAKFGVQGKLYTINRDTEPESVSQSLKEHNIQQIITLGTGSLRFATHLNQQQQLDLDIIAGGIATIPEGYSGVSLTASPDSFFKLLNSIAPQVKTVSLVYNETLNGWWVKQAVSLAKNKEIKLKPYLTHSIKEGVQHYKTIMENAVPGKEAIWIPLADLVPNKIIMPLVLKKAWQKEIFVFSNNPLHAKQGALFSLYPDNNKLANQLAHISKKMRIHNKNIIAPTYAVKAAVNIRTAKHLGVKWSKQELRSFDRIYPLR